MGGFVHGGPVCNLHSSISRVSFHRLKNFRIFMINSMPRSVFFEAQLSQTRLHEAKQSRILDPNRIFRDCAEEAPAKLK